MQPPFAKMRAKEICGGLLPANYIRYRIHSSGLALGGLLISKCCCIVPLTVQDGGSGESNEEKCISLGIQFINRCLLRSQYNEYGNYLSICPVPSPSGELISII